MCAHAGFSPVALSCNIERSGTRHEHTPTPGDWQSSGAPTRRSNRHDVNASRLSALARSGICVAPSGWTIVLHRDGRRSRLWRADVAQLVAHHLAKVRVAGSNPVIRSKGAVASTPAVEWPSGEATACKAVHTGSIPVSTSEVRLSAISSAGERFPDTEEVTGSIPVSRTSIIAVQAMFLRS